MMQHPAIIARQVERTRAAWASAGQASATTAIRAEPSGWRFFTSICASSGRPSASAAARPAPAGISPGRNT
jgi:hypothetical protein